MNLETKLQIQAWLDGELPEAEARQVGSRVEQDAEAKMFAAELKTLRSVLVGNEPELKLPESREFFWSKIRREIERLDVQEAALSESGVPWWHSWRRWLLPAAGTALLAICAIVASKLSTTGGAGADPFLAEVENLSEHFGSYSFRAPGEKMFVVWVYDRADVRDARANDDFETFFQ